MVPKIPHIKLSNTQIEVKNAQKMRKSVNLDFYVDAKKKDKNIGSSY